MEKQRRNRITTAAMPTTAKNSDHANVSASADGASPVKLPVDLDNLRAALMSDLTSAITDQLKRAIDAALAPIAAAIEGFTARIDSQDRRIVDLEQHLSSYSDRVVSLERAVEHLSTANKQLTDKMEDLESRSRRCNLRVVGIPEGAEGADPVAYMSNFFADVLGADVFQSPPLLDRAHRIGPKPSNPNAGGLKPRVFIVRFHYYQDKERAWRWGIVNKKQLTHDGRNIYIFPDFNASVAKKRAAFTNMRRCLKEKGVQFSLRFPAQLRIDHGDEKLHFNSPMDAQSWFDSKFPSGWTSLRFGPSKYVTKYIVYFKCTYGLAIDVI